MSAPTYRKWQRDKRYQWAVSYPNTPESDFALFTCEEDAKAFVTLMKLIDGKEYEIEEIRE